MVDLRDKKFRRRLSAGRPIEDRTGYSGKRKLEFQLPGGFPLEISPPPPVLIPIPPAPKKPTIPVKIDHTKGGRDFSRAYRKALANARKLNLARHEADRLRRARALKYGRLAGSLGPTLGFAIGWELGDYLWPQGWYSFTENYQGDFAGYTFPSNWVEECNSGDGEELWRSGTQAVYSEGGWSTTSGDVGTGGNCGAGTARYHQGQVQPDHAISTANFTRLTSYHYHGEVAPNPQPNIKWFQVTRCMQKRFGSTGPQPEVVYINPTYTQPMPLVSPKPAQFPETFPMSQPMEMPFPQKWKEAKPEPYTQGEGKHRKGHYEGVIPQLPLTPFPVVAVIPPGGNVPPPPDQVIDIPPPPPFTEGPYPVKPPTYHVRPPQGRKPPGKRTKESPKLSVRTVANKAWIVLNFATEAFDAIDALFDALPKHCQDKAKASIDYGRKGGGNADPYSKAKAIYDCFGEIDWNKFVNNFINMQLTDMAVGIIGMTSQRYLKMTGQATGSGGLASKPGNTADKFLEAWVDEQVEAGHMTKEEGQKILESGQLPIPQVEYQGDGVWTVSIDAWGLTFK